MSPLPGTTSITDIEIETGTSGVAWGAIIGGAFAIAGISLILIPLGTAFGFAAISPWHQTETSKVLSAASAIWLIVSQWISAGLGGYLTGRLRTKWAGAHTHEVFFRDTAHGFLTWSLAAVFSALLLMGVPSHFGNHAKPDGANDRGTPLETHYTDRLFRSPQGTVDVPESDRRQATYILVEAVASKNGISAEDHNYLIRIVSARTGLNATDSEARINDVVARLKTGLDEARKAASILSLMVGIALLIGAFIACAASALGGRDRDIHYTTGRFTP